MRVFLSFSAPGTKGVAIPLRILAVVIIVVAVLSSVASAQIRWSSSAQLGILTLKQVDMDGYTIIQTDARPMKYKVTADFGRGFVTEILYGLGRAGDLTNGGSISPNEHIVSMVQFNARYALYQGERFVAGPMWSRETTYWRFKVGKDLFSYTTSSMGLGAFASTTIGPAVITAVYLNRPIVALTISAPGIHGLEDIGAGYLWKLGAEYPISDVTSLVASYELDAQYREDSYRSDGFNQVLSGTRIGLRFAF